MRLNKFISHHTSFSRREADKLIFDGKVKVNGKVVTNPAYEVLDGDKVAVNGKPVKKSTKYTCIIYNKPRGELVTKKDDRGRKTIYDSLPKKYKHFIPIGRLDFASEGLLILTDSPKVADALMKSDLPRVYKLRIKGNITPEIEKAMQEGVEIGVEGAHEKTKQEKIKLKPFYSYQIIKNDPKYSTLKVAITEGKNRELRRFFAHFGRDVLDLKRLSYGWVALNALPTGKTRYFDKREYKLLKEFLKERDAKAKNKN
ncbi:pseudouridine synthase [Caminibacter mediatlanticus]|uniref:Pseudouridine synthase n=1 Tax=Caminibacter mediatlanticus TB-2 TaxID=391592 RepID=A0AAI9AH72_9BACT|nr:pseudouridine synthase [Caminibacter mediatlanticus]EDM23444.1 Pseudouridine synthase, Rsu [Caminibacter mediatlanticus TB-2]